MIRSSRRGRLAPGEMFPAGIAGYRVSFPRLRSGLSVRVIERGDPQGPPVLFIPGWGCSVYLYRRNLPAIADAGFRAISVDLKGHGLSDKPVGEGEYRIEPLVDHIAEILDALELERAALVGHSMGATLSYHFARRYPERARCLALLSPVGLTGFPLLWLYRALTPSFISPVIRRFRPRAVVKIALNRVYGRRGGFTEEDVDEYWAPTRFPENGLALRDLLHAYDWDALRHRQLPVTNIPAIGIWGSRDHLMPKDGMDAYMALLPGISLTMIPDAGHIIPEEVPDAVNPRLIALLHTVASSAR